MSNTEAFQEYIKNSRDTFVLAIQGAEWNTTLRTQAEDLLICFDQMSAALSATPSPTGERLSAERDLHSITEGELLDLLAIDGIGLSESLTKQSEDDDISFIKDNGMWSKDAFVGNEYVIFKGFTYDGKQRLFIPVIWEQKGLEDVDAGVHPYHIEIGGVTDMMGSYLAPVKVIEWFLSKGFKVGNFQLASQSTPSAATQEVKEDAGITNEAAMNKIEKHCKTIDSGGYLHIHVHHIRDLMVQFAESFATRPQSTDATEGENLELNKMITFEEFIEHGKDNGANIVNGMPWSWYINGKSVTHENDDCYIIEGIDGSVNFYRGDNMMAFKNGLRVFPNELNDTHPPGGCPM